MDNNTNNQKTSKNNEKLADLFHRVSRFMARAYHSRDYSNHAQARVLSIIREKGSVYQKDLLEMLDVRSASLSEILGKLERNGQIVRKKNEEDKRGFIISAGQETQPAGDGRAEASVKEADGPFTCLDDQEREQLGGILEKMAKALKDDTRREHFEERRNERDGRKTGHGHGRSQGFERNERGRRTANSPGQGTRGRHRLKDDHREQHKPKHEME